MTSKLFPLSSSGRFIPPKLESVMSRKMPKSCVHGAEACVVSEKPTRRQLLNLFALCDCHLLLKPSWVLCLHVAKDPDANASTIAILVLQYVQLSLYILFFLYVRKKKIFSARFLCELQEVHGCIECM